MPELDEIAPDLCYVGVNDRSKQRFESLWSLPYGVSYNSYLIRDERVALLDTVDACFADRFMQRLGEQLGDRPVDFLVLNHMEPDHSAAIRAVRARYPQVQIVGNRKTLDMVAGYYGITEGLHEVGDGERLTLGRHTLSFHLTPMVHWPETMMTFDEAQGVLFSGDAFGCYGALDGAVVDRHMETDRFWGEMVRYYATIVGKYGAPVQRALAKLAGLPIRMICPTHGPVWTEQLERVVALYGRMARYEAEAGVEIVYGSMYGHTEQAAEAVARELARCGVRRIVVHNLSYTDLSVALRDLFLYDTLIVGSPTYNGELFPEVTAFLQAVAERGVSPRRYACFGAYTWADASQRRLQEFGERMQWPSVAEPVVLRQGGTPDQWEACRALARAVAAAR